jgi:lipoyl(octanoyl) transferase
MQAFTAARTPETPDELWLCEHPPVFTLGLAGKPEHLLEDIGIPVVRIDRGGQITYHGPGQLVCYLLLDLKRRGLTVKGLVNRMEQAVIDLLAGYGIAAQLNVNMDLSPFAAINPCGYAGMAVTHLCAFSPGADMETVGAKLLARLQRLL